MFAVEIDFVVAVSQSHLRNIEHALLVRVQQSNSHIVLDNLRRLRALQNPSRTLTVYEIADREQAFRSSGATVRRVSAASDMIRPFIPST